jgi:hypothetical protein
MAYDGGREMAAFNLAMPYLTRVNGILNSNYTEFKAGNARGFSINLKQLYRELVPWLTVDKVRGIDQTKELRDAFTALSKIPKHNKDAIWNKMEDIEMMMRIQFKQLGMLMPKISDPRHLFGNRQK